MSRTYLPLGLVALSYARDFVGLRELPGNHGPGVGYFQRQAQIPAGSPWCAAFVNGIIDISCAVKDVYSPFEGGIRQGYVQDYYDLAHGKTWIVIPARAYPGCIFTAFSSEKNRMAHIGFVSGVNMTDGVFWTVEGNTNNDGDREGHSVVERERKIERRYAFIDWAPAHVHERGPAWTRV